MRLIDLPALFLNVSRSNIRAQVWWLEIWHGADHLGYFQTQGGEWNKPHGKNHHLSHLNVALYRKTLKLILLSSCVSQLIQNQPNLAEKGYSIGYIHILLDRLKESDYFLGSKLLQFSFLECDNLKLQCREIIGWNAAHIHPLERSHHFFKLKEENILVITS